jgi:hypothetical protein
MGEMRKTIWMAAGAALLAVLAIVTTPRQKTPEAFFDHGETFFPDFTDPNAARTLEVVTWDEEQGGAVPFKVTYRNGRWTIPSHYDYPADGRDRLARTATSLIGVTKDDFRTDNAADFAACGVVDPMDGSNPSPAGRGQRITIKGENDVVLADLIIGNAFEGREGFRLVRVPDEKRVYGVRINVDVSTRFKDWIESDLMMIDKEEIARLTLKDYSIDETSGRLDVRDEVEIGKDGEDWSMKKVPAGKEADTYKINTLVKTIDELSIEDVRPKPEGLTASLSRAADGMSITQSDMMSLQSRGFYFARDGRLVSNEGELLARTRDGVVYTLRFGEVAVGTEASASEAGDATAGENRYLMISASFDATAFPEPDKPSDLSFQGKPDSVLTDADRRQRELKAGHDRWQGRVTAARERAEQLNARFAGWYYVISGESFEALHLKRTDLVRDKPKQS